MTDGHDWSVYRDGLTACRRCGIVQRADRGNKPCRGPVRVTLREEDILPAVEVIPEPRPAKRAEPPEPRRIDTCPMCGARRP